MRAISNPLVYYNPRRVLTCLCCWQPQPSPCFLYVLHIPLIPPLDRRIEVSNFIEFHCISRLLVLVSYPYLIYPLPRRLNRYHIIIVAACTSVIFSSCFTHVLDISDLEEKEMMYNYVDGDLDSSRSDNKPFMY